MLLEGTSRKPKFRSNKGNERVKGDECNLTLRADSGLGRLSLTQKIRKDPLFKIHTDIT